MLGVWGLLLPTYDSISKIDTRIIIFTGMKTGDNGNAMLPKKFEFQRDPPKDFCTARYEHKSSKKKFQNFSKTPKIIIPGQILGQDRPEKNSAKC